jgi:hypothetical protein
VSESASQLVPLQLFIAYIFFLQASRAKPVNMNEVNKSIQDPSISD